MKGIVINYKTIKQIYEYNPEKLTLDEINKLSTIEGKKVQINKREFVQIINVLGNLINKGAFSRLDNSQLFFINLSNSIAEFDILTILKEYDKNIIVNIEVKSSEKDNEGEIEFKLKTQLNSRIDDHLQQMFIEDNYLALGYVNDKFYLGLYKEKESKVNEINEEQAVELIGRCKYNIQTYSKVQISDNLSNIQGVYTKLKNNTFRMYAINKKVIDRINTGIVNKKKVIMCLAKPGYGKTVLALNLFFNNESTKFLILNQKFYNTFSMNEYYNSNRAFFGTETFIGQLDSNTIAIVDEAQRLNRNTLNRIIQNSKSVILFGDTGQAFMQTDEFMTEANYEDAVKKCVGDNYEKIRLKNPIRYSEEVDRALKYIYDKRCEKKDLRKIVNFEIKIYNTKEEFFRNYNSIMESKKIFKMYTSGRLEEAITVKIDGNEYVYNMADKEYWNYAISGNTAIFGHTLHAISFDVENAFLFLDNLIYSEDRKMPVPEELNVIDEIKFQKYINELDILLTRARRTLNIYVEDLRTFLWFNEKIADINNTNQVLNE